MGNSDSKIAAAGGAVGGVSSSNVNGQHLLVVSSGHNGIKSSSENECTVASTDCSTNNLNNKDENMMMMIENDPNKKHTQKGSHKNKTSKRNNGGRNGGRNGNSNNQSNSNSNNLVEVQTRDDEQTPSSYIADEQVQVNLAMSDLMAYLQVVANNSSNLPITKRDDFELDRFVTSLSPEEYARKAAAFVPADVRVIGGTFTRYGRVWDLPTSEEYNACDGAQEPGRSYGGACVNSMLKVLYDAANDHVGGETGVGEKNADALFDDDDDSDDEDASTWGKSFKSTFSIEANTSHTCTINWSDLLRKMKAEMKDIEYAQIPKLTTSRKMDLSKTFSLIGENFDPAVNTKRSLLVGCNYRNMPGAELKASHDDIRSMKDYIVNVHGFPETKGLMTILMDDEAHKYPTFLNIVEAFKVLSEESKPGDAVFVLFSGHGGRVLDAPHDAESYDEVILPCDFKQSGLIRDTLIFKTLIAPMRYGVTVTILIDCCDTGMVLEMPYAWSAGSRDKDSLSQVGKMTMNEDFSFVRFLKVVKTLYEASTFTQLGKTVGSALKPNTNTQPSNNSNNNSGAMISSSINAASNEDAEMDVVSERYSSKQDSMVPTHESILDALTEACRPVRSRVADQQAHLKAAGCGSGGRTAASKREEAPRQSLLEQVMNCTLLAPQEEDYLSDDDTFRTRTYDDEVASDAVVESFESLTEDEEDFKRGRARRKKR